MEKRVSVIITVRNEQDNIDALLKSLQNQVGLQEIILVDACSSDDTVVRASAWEKRLPLRIIVEDCTRGHGRNIGAKIANGDVLAFIDGDCRAEPGWVAALAAVVEENVIAAGHTSYEGPYPANRLPVYVDGQDVTWPSCNLAYPAALFRSIDGFDVSFLTAEDVDLNLRAVAAGATITEAPGARIIAQTRPGLGAHLRQAYAYGIGRKQLQNKHQGLPVAPVSAALKGHASPRGILRLAAGWCGYRFGDTP